MDKLIKFGLILLLVSVPLFFLRHIGGGFYFSIYDEAKEVLVQLLILVLFCLSLGRDSVSVTEIRSRRRDSVSASLVIFFLFIVASLLWATNRYESLRFIKRWASYILLYFLVVNNVKGVRETKAFIVAMVGTSILVALYGIAQYFGWEFPHIYQTITRNATLGNPSFAGWFLVTSLPLSLIMATSSPKRGWRTFFYLASLILFIHLIITLTRASWMGLTLGLLVISFFCFKQRFFRLRWTLTVVSVLALSNLFLTFITPAFVGRVAERLKPKQREYAYKVSAPLPTAVSLPEAMPLPAVAPLPKEIPLFQPGAPWWLERIATIFRRGYGTNRQRFVIWSGILKMIKDRPILGVGVGNFNLFYPFYQLNREAAIVYADHFIRQAHNEYLQFAAELGLVGLGLFIWFISVLFITLWRKILAETESPGRDRISVPRPNLGAETESRPIGLGLLGGFLATSVVAFFGFNLQSEASSLYFWFGVGLVGALTNVRNGRDRILAPRPNLGDRDRISARWLVAITILGMLIFIPRTIYRPFLAYWHKQMGYCLTTFVNNKEMAIRELEKSVSIYPHSWEAQFILAGCYSDLKRYAEAEKAYTQALRLNPGYAKTYYNLGNTYYHTGRVDKAIEFYSKALQIDPYFTTAYHNIATIYYQRGDIKLAVDYLYQGAVRVYEVGGLNTALSELRTCLELDPQFEKAKQLMETIEKQLK
jgi:tetratricopeptide (TPR) repeat protein